jgi:hypothetical protein
MKRFLLWLTLVSGLLSSCGTLSVNIDWGPTAVSEQIVTATPWVTPSPFSQIDVTPTPDITATPLASPTAIGNSPAAPLAFASHDRIYWINEMGEIYPLSDTAYRYSDPLVSPKNDLVVFMGTRPEPPLKGWVLKDIVLASPSRAFEPRVLVGSSTDTLLGFSPDGQWLLTRRAIIKNDQDWIDFSLQAINLISGEDRLIVEPITLADGSVALPINPIWAPDSQHIFYDTIARCGMCVPNGELRVVDISTRKSRSLLGPAQSGDLVFSPDGLRLLVVGPTQAISFPLQDVYTSATSFTPQVLITYRPPQMDRLRYALPQARWVDIDRVRLALPTVENDQPVLTFWEISTRDLRRTQLAAYKGIEILWDSYPFPHNMLSALWSPNMQHIALNLRIKTNEGDRIDIIMTDGSGQNPVEMLHTPLFVNWSPDSLHYIFLMPPAGATGDLLIGTKEVYLCQADNAGQSSMLLPGTAANIDPRSIRWLNESTYVFETIESGGNVLWRGVINGPTTRLE